MKEQIEIVKSYLKERDKFMAEQQRREVFLQIASMYDNGTLQLMVEKIESDSCLAHMFKLKLDQFMKDARKDLVCFNENANKKVENETTEEYY